MSRITRGMLIAELMLLINKERDNSSFPEDRLTVNELTYVVGYLKVLKTQIKNLLRTVSDKNKIIRDETK